MNTFQYKWFRYICNNFSIWFVLRYLMFVIYLNFNNLLPCILLHLLPCTLLLLLLLFLDIFLLLHIFLPFLHLNNAGYCSSLFLLHHPSSPQEGKINTFFGIVMIHHVLLKRHIKRDHESHN